MATINKHIIILGIILVFLFTCDVSAGYANGHSCSNNAECDSLNCNMGYCCGRGECGSYYGCFKDGAVNGIGGGPSVVCRNGSWFRPWGEGCSDYACDFGTTCISGHCCYAGQCSYTVGMHGNCFNVGDVIMNGLQCGEGGIWKKKNAATCANNSECASNNCNAGYCCNGGECGSYYGCLKEGQCMPTSLCNSGCYNGTFKKYFGASCSSTSDCSSGTCINGFCCNPGQCGYSTSKTGNCYNIGDEHYIYRCVSEGTWKTLDGYACNDRFECASDKCVDGICVEKQCSNLWWFDNDVRVCGLNEFCDQYAYYGLRTFSTQAECLKELTGVSCVGEGESIQSVMGSADCCIGLTPINKGGVNSSGGCVPPLIGAEVCTYCGNGVCGVGENKCNCPADCFMVGGNSTTTTTIPNVPEFAAFAMPAATLAVLFGFAYLAAKRKD